MNARPTYLPPKITIVGFLMEKGYQASTIETPPEPINQFQLMMETGEGQQQQRPFEVFNYHDGWGETNNNFFQ